MPKPLSRNDPYGFEKNVFINCPFDEAYLPLFRAIIFTVHDLGLTARCALEQSNAGEVRIAKIQNIIAECKYSVHDLSRTELDKLHNLPRFNMPFELGLDLGCRRFGNKNQRRKVILVMDVEPFRYQKFISDISGQDVYAHNGTQRGVINQVRDWLRPALFPEKILPPGSAHVLTRFTRFKKALPSICAGLNWNPKRLSFHDYLFATGSWINANPVTRA